ncbi:MAG: protein translocase subunit SecD [Candidatus Buchananbacteria bacterium]|nr:protein translocase subunit SecD [Candidatus Buchananbacteria bacterium]
MPKNPISNIFTPGPRGKLRWALIGILALVLIATWINVLHVPTVVTRQLDATLSVIPVVNDLKVWPEIKHDTQNNTRSVVWHSVREVDLQNFGQPFRLGLDLLGGAHLVYEADVSAVAESDRTEAIAGVRDVIERRVNSLGVSEPLVQTNRVGDKYRVLVELAGVYDINEAINKIGETPLLEFKEENPDGAAAAMTGEQEQELNRRTAEVQKKAQGLLDQIKGGADFAQLARDNTDDSGSKDTGGLYTGIKRGEFVPEFDDVLFTKLKVGEVYPQLVKSDFGYHIIKKEAERGIGEAMEVDTRHILLLTPTPADVGVVADMQWQGTKLTGKNLKRASVELDQQSGAPTVSLQFDDEGAKLFGEITERNSGKLVAIFLDGEPISIPRVNEPIYAGQAQITGSFTVIEAKQLAQRLNAGALPVPVQLVSQTTVGASLGLDSMTKSLFAGLIGFAIIALFMIIYYRLPGVVAVIALLMYISITLALFKLLSVTLTLAGIAGFILSIGMAVDANVLIFERIKEELRAGRELTFAVREGFHRAWSSIRDSNVSSLITCSILFWFGTSIIRGFALTLALGIIVSMFSSITITRNLMLLITKWRGLKALPLYARIKRNS